MNEEQFDRILRKVLDGTATPIEQKQVDQWLASFPEQAFEEIPAIEKQAIKNRMQERIQKHIQPNPVRRLPWYRHIAWQLAAALVVLIGAGLAGYQYWANRVTLEMAYANAKEIHKVILPDGTLVWLKDSSSLEYPSRFTGNLREVKLHGEAFFEVAKNPEHPFMIHSGRMTTKVLGTSFNIRNRAEKLEVVVFTGKVMLSSPQGQVTLLPAQKAVYQQKSQDFKPEILQPSEPEKLTYIQGTEYPMQFEDVPMFEVLTRIEKKFNVHIISDKKSIYDCLLRADLTDQSLENTLSVLTQTFGGTYVIEGSSVELKGLNCQ
ncbi:FecR family protein [Siphonobacter sp. SORGH_AS_0500]|uniref:FecR family protein n=1 Tax=Siphonobacter sp. SORGH_AS_0500 TaxID=1864824 RepID=UPI000CAF8DFE|nr:FecR domain-containing protein [Siphonobacter sp. SORGH_AS_0500]MDR6197870.1 transmembrane sensor [Siphonobacter sp. SORGH_AS_0500]PKK37223.1 hypothetical protein BWI96_07710 [Siphonobacter sp. SORGH_AS_0500]